MPTYADEKIALEHVPRDGAYHRRRGIERPEHGVRRFTQIDLQRGQKSGLIEARRILKEVRGIAFTEFDASDVVRHPLVARIVAAYEKHAEPQNR